MSFGIPVRNGVGVGLLASTSLSTRNRGGPFAGAALYLNFLSGSLDSRITFARGTTGTFVGSNGLIQSAAINTPRFDYDPVTLAPRGLLIEEQRTNLLLQSENFATTWGGPPVTGTLTANATTSPAGTGNATLFVPSITPVNHDINQNVTAAAVSYTLSVYAKAQLYNHLFLQYFDGTTDRLAYFNLSTGAIGTTSGSPSPTITAVGNGWYRCTTTFTGVVGRNGFVVGAAPSDGGRAVAGNGTSGIYIWGAQLEQASFATSYIPTVASTVTRSADVATLTGTNFSSWYNQSEGTVVANFDTAIGSTATGVVFGGGSNVFQTKVEGGRARSGIRAVVDLITGAGPTVSMPGSSSVASAYRTGDNAIAANGGAAVTSAVTFTASGGALVALGSDGLTNTNWINGHIRQLAYFNTRLPNAQLQAITA